MRFWGLSVLQGHGALLSGGDFWWRFQPTTKKQMLSGEQDKDCLNDAKKMPNVNTTACGSSLLSLHKLLSGSLWVLSVHVCVWWLVLSCPNFYLLPRFLTRPSIQPMVQSCWRHIDLLAPWDRQSHKASQDSGGIASVNANKYQPCHEHISLLCDLIWLDEILSTKIVNWLWLQASELRHANDIFKHVMLLLCICTDSPGPLSRDCSCFWLCMLYSFLLFCCSISSLQGLIASNQIWVPSTPFRSSIDMQTLRFGLSRTINTWWKCQWQ